MTEQTHADLFEWEPVRETKPQKFAEAYMEKETLTIGTTTTEWITSDTVMEIRE